MPNLRRGYLPPGAIIVLAGICLFVALTLIFNAQLLRNLNKQQEQNQASNLVAQPSPTTASNWKTYTNTSYKYSLKYPPNLQVATAVEGLPGNEASRNLETTCCINIIDNTNKTLLQLNVISEKRTISQIKESLKNQFGEKISDIIETNLSGQKALTYTLYGNQKSAIILRDDYEYEFSIVDQETSNQILSNLKFTD